MSRTQSESLFKTAQSHFVGGVNSPVRAFKGVGGSPVFAASGNGAEVIDVDHHRYIDYVLSWGPLILGHAHPEVITAVQAAVAQGTSFGMPTAAENRLAENVRRFFPELEKLRFVNSGTEATMSALRLARGFTGRDKIVKFVGCYHGHADSLLVAAGSGLATFGAPSSPGVTAGTAADTLTLPFNDCEALRTAFQKYGQDLAAVILEIVPCNMGLVFPDPEFLSLLQDQCGSYGTLLIADEVLTGLRASRGGAYHRFGVRPDLVALGKVVGGGFPLAAYGGRKDIMAKLSPEGAVYQAGTLSGNPIAATAGAITLDILLRDDPFATLELKATQLAQALRQHATAHNIPLWAGAVGSLFGFAFREGPARNFVDMQAADHERYAKFFWACLEGGVYLAPSGYEVGFVSTAHDDDKLAHTTKVFGDAFAAL